MSTTNNTNNNKNKTTLSKIEQEKLKAIMEDPVLWAKAHIITYDNVLKRYTPWTARWYQAEMLRDNSRKKVYRNGRRTGKCLPGWVKIKDPITKKEYQVKDLFKKGYANVYCVDIKNNTLCTQTHCPVFDNGIKEVFKVELGFGAKSIEATGNHPLYKMIDNNHWEFTEIDDLKIGDFIAVVDHEGKMIPLLITDIKSIGFFQTYDLTVPEYHNFIANDVVVHNTEAMVVEALYQVNTHREFVFVFVAPYENQIRLLFTRLLELVNGSPLLKKKMIRNTKNPYLIEFQNNSRIIGFTTGASSNSGGASIRGQRANMIACDEMDYLGDGDFENISMLAAERDDIRMVCSSTPTGRRGQFWKICTDKSCGFSEHHIPSTMNPNWSDQMEAEFRAELSELGYIHEVLADFGPQDTGVFNKDDLDKAIQMDNYAYNELTKVQEIKLERTGEEPPVMYLPIAGKFKSNIFRTMGVDWDKFQASSSIVILDFDQDFGKFRITKRIEVPKSEYSYDTAVNMIVDLNKIYNPSWIYVDRGAGKI